MDRELSDVHTSIRLREFNDSIRTNTEEIHVPTPSDQDGTGNKKLETILNVCEELKASLAKQQEDIDQLKRPQIQSPSTYASKTKVQLNSTPNPFHQIPDANYDAAQEDFPPLNWERVEKKKKKNKGKEPTKKENIRRRPQPDSIAVKPSGGETNRDILNSFPV